MDVTKVLEPPLLLDGLPPQVSTTTNPPDAVHIAPLDQEETPKVRTKLRLYLILTALYVSQSAPLAVIVWWRLPN